MSHSAGGVAVQIRGRSYRIGGISPGRARKAARILDAAISGAMDSAPRARPYDQVVLAALFIADQLADERERHVGTVSQVTVQIERLARGVETTLSDGHGSSKAPAQPL